jgi:hypothetical protein
MRRLVLIAGLAFFASLRALAECQCPSISKEEQVAAATYVFNGEVWDVFQNPTIKKRVMTFDINDTFKGNPKAQIEMNDAEDGTECATDFHEGDTYLVYARWQWGALLTSRCWGTKLIKDATADAKTLGASSSVKEKFYQDLQKYCMGKIDTPCCLSSVKAMKAGGYLPKPEEGCPNEMIPDGLRCGGGYIWCIPDTDPSRHNQKPK